MRLGIIIAGLSATAFAILVDSIYGLWVFGLDIAYVVLFPELTCALFVPFTNTYGALTGWVLGLVFRLGGGEPVLRIPPLIKYPHYDACSERQLAPFKTIAMLVCLLSILVVSFITEKLFTHGVLPEKADVFKCYEDDFSMTYTACKVEIKGREDNGEDDDNMNRIDMHKEQETSMI